MLVPAAKFKWEQSPDVHTRPITWLSKEHRGIKKPPKYILGFKSFEVVEATIAGIELHRMLKKGQMENVGEMSA